MRRPYSDNVKKSVKCYIFIKKIYIFKNALVIIKQCIFFTVGPFDYKVKIVIISITVVSGPIWTNLVPNGKVIFSLSKIVKK